MSFDSYAALKQALLEAAARAVGLDDTSRLRLSDPPSPEHGDVSLACHALSGTLKKKPPEIAETVAAALQPCEFVEAATGLQGFCNVRFTRDALWDTAVREVSSEPSAFGRSPEPAQTWLIEFSGPNTNKPLHIGHLRNTILGAALANITRLHGHDVKRYNIINDRGIHICKSMVAYEQFGEGSTPKQTGEKGDHFVGRFYSLFASKAAEEFKAWAEGPGQEGLDDYLQEHDASLREAADQRLRKDFLATQDAKSLPFKPKKIKAVKYAALMQESGELESAYQAWLAERSDEADNLRQQEGIRRFQAVQARQFEIEVSPLHRKSRDFLRLWEENDPAIRTLWSTMNGWVLAGIERTYERLGVVFDFVDYESETYLLGKEIVGELLNKGIARLRDDGAAVFEMPAKSKKELPKEKVILRADGTSVYITQDLGTLVRRYERHKPDRIIYVVGSEQELHFETLFTLVGRHIEGLEPRCTHLSYGMVELPHGKMKSREGDIVEADQFLDDVTTTAAAEIRSRNEDLPPEAVQERAEVISLAAVKYHLLKYNKRSTVKFDVEEALDQQGKTGTYCLYALARIRSILRSLEEQGANTEIELSLDGSQLSASEAALVHGVLHFPEVVGQAVRDLEPYHIADYVYRLARQFSTYYTEKDEAGRIKNHILNCPDPDQKRLRITLIRLVEHALEQGLESLGIRTLAEV